MFLEGMLVDVVRGEHGHRTHTAWQWCVVLVVRMWPLGGARVVVMVELAGIGGSSSLETGTSLEGVLVDVVH
jgi:hypothetical protein